MATERPRSFGELLRHHRHAAGLTLNELGVRAGLSAKGIGALERGERRAPHRETVSLLTDALQLPPTERAVLEGAARQHAARVRPPRHPHYLPLPLTLLLGREQEVAELCELLGRGEVRLVTLTGPPGVGKTRLALAVAAELADDFADSVWFVPLARLPDPALVLPTIARTLGLQEAGSAPIAHVLREWLRTRHVLLLLDNCEQVVEAAPRVAKLLEACPGLKVLVTSRVPLHLRGEREYPVPPLDLPPAASGQPSTLPALTEQQAQSSLERLTNYAAVALFLMRARDALPRFQVTPDTARTVAQICARLDGLPLAIELAAPWVKLLPPVQLLARLERRLLLLVGGARDTDARQQTMHAALAWSYDLLSADEQCLFRRLAVFVGGWTLQAAEAVCARPAGAEPIGTSALAGLGALVDQSLVQQRSVDGEGMGTTEQGGGGEARFRLLHVVREYALERLEGSAGGQEPEALRRAHAVYYLALVEGRELAMYGSEPAVWLGQLEREHDNFRAALAWARERGEVELGLRLASALAPFWDIKGCFSEGRMWLETLLGLAPQAAGAGEGDGDEENGDADSHQVSAVARTVVVRAKALSSAGMFAWRQGDYDRALTAAEETLALARDQQSGWADGHAFGVLSGVAGDRGELPRAAVYLEECMAHLRAAGEEGLAAAFLTTVGAIAAASGDLERAAACCEESLAFARRVGADLVEGAALGGLADVARRRGDVADAARLGHEQLVAWRGLGVPGHLASCLEGLGLTAVATGDGMRAARLLGAAATQRARLGITRDPQEWWDATRAVAPARAALGEEDWVAAYAAGQALSLEEAVAEALGEVADAVAHKTRMGLRGDFGAGPDVWP